MFRVTEDRKKLGDSFVETLNESGVRNIRDIPEGRGASTPFEESHLGLPFERPVDESKEDAGERFVQSLNKFGITDIKDIPKGCYTPKEYYQKVWVIK